MVRALSPSSDPTAVIEEYDDAPRYLVQKKKAQAKSLELPGEPIENRCKKYLRKRGFDPDYVEEKYGLQYGGVVGVWRYRLLIPVFNRERHLLTFQGRDITGLLEERYKTLSIEKSVRNPKDVLFNIQNAKFDIVGVAEGPMDVMRLGDGVVAGLGSTMTQNQIMELSQFKKVVFVFDPEPEAQAKALKYANELSAIGVEAEVIDTQLDHDPGDSTEDEVKEIRELIFG